MPLSEHEQRLLEQIERALVDDDPKFASTVRTGDRRQKARRKLQLGVLLVVVGLAVVVAGVAIPAASVAQVVVGVLGFLIAFGGATMALLNYKAATGAVEVGPVSGGRPTTGGSSRVGKARRQPMKNRLEERFRRRYDQ